MKEDLYTFQGTKLFPERKSSTAEYELSDAVKLLYECVAECVREEMNRATATPALKAMPSGGLSC